MNSTQTCYWIQGHFELQSHPSALQPRPIALIRARLLSREPEANDGEREAFCSWLEGFLAACSEARPGLPLSERHTRIIREKLDALFVHAAAPAPEPTMDMSPMPRPSSSWDDGRNPFDSQLIKC